MAPNTKSPTALDRRIGQRLRARRLAARMSQETLAAKLGLTFQQVQKYEKGTNRIGASRLATAAELLGVSVLTFYDDEEKREPQAEAVPALLSTREGSRLATALASLPPQLLRPFAQLAEQIAALQAPEPH